VCPTCQGSGQVRRSSGFFSIAQTCPACGGEGHIIDKPCKSCRGSGTERKSQKVKVTIPAGIEDGKRIRLEGQGDAAPHGGLTGDLYVYIHVRGHDSFERNGNDLYCMVPLSMTQAALGAEINVSTLDGKIIKLKIPAGTQNGKLFRIKEAGVPVLQAPSRKGDLFIKVHVQVPTNLTAKAKDLLSQLSAIVGEDDSPKPVKLSSIE
jgi:molecular chaperone DnaJ